jgi:hypothetical protein
MAKRKPVIFKRQESLPASPNDNILKVIDSLQCNTSVRHLNVIWPQANSICCRLYEYILDVIPSPDGDSPLINMCLNVGVETLEDALIRWRKHEITDTEVLSTFIMALITTAANAAQWEVTSCKSKKVLWPQNHNSLYNWWCEQEEDISINFNKNMSENDVNLLQKSIHAYVLNNFDANLASALN